LAGSEENLPHSVTLERQSLLGSHRQSRWLTSWSYLKRFPIDTLKIDRSFVQDIATDSDDANIVSAMIGMGVNLRQRVIAEGVETREQLRFLRNQRCPQGQGFYFNRPLRAGEFARLLTARGKSQWPAQRESNIEA